MVRGACPGSFGILVMRPHETYDQSIDTPLFVFAHKGNL